MSDNTFTPGPTPNTVRTADGKVQTVPDGWVLLPPDWGKVTFGELALKHFQPTCFHANEPNSSPQRSNETGKDFPQRRPIAINTPTKMMAIPTN